MTSKILCVKQIPFALPFLTRNVALSNACSVSSDPFLAGLFIPPSNHHVLSNLLESAFRSKKHPFFRWF